ncbi:hypothetical protein N665_0006s0123 [Sinapis alba]|nr:hypothetical protein N665_0006s0123 [Sinapis alba]KAF8118127.1 hypothetical protein N665_0006s0123 [Sinapis alba]
MTNKKGLFTLLKRVFISETNSEKKEKRRRWTFWKLKVRKRLPTITAPPPENGIRNESHEEQKEESVSDVGEVSSQKLDSSIEKLEGSTSPETAHLVAQYQLFLNREEEVLAATRIQTAFRGHLARKALRALKGIVKLQAYIRGRAVRRQAMTTLKCLQSVVNIQSQVCGKRTQIPRGSHRDYEESNTGHMFSENILKVDTNGQKRWDDSLLTKEEARAVVMSKKEAALRRERIKEYAVTHRKSAESYQKRSNTKWKYWLDEWVDTQRTKSKELEDLDLSSRTKPKDETMNKTPRNSSPRRLVSNSSNHRRQASISEEEPQNPVAAVTVTTPTYMVATESAKAKSRSSSSPRIRPRSFDTQSESYSPYKNKLCLTSSVMSEAPSKVRVGNSNGNNSRASAYQQRSPGLRGFSIGPLKSCNNGTLLNDLSINSERSLPSWSKQSSLR